MRYNLRVDANQKDVVQALKQVGASVYVIGRPVDLLVGYRQTTFLLEVKNTQTAYGRKGLSKSQLEFATSWRGGKVWAVSSVSEALAVLGIPVLAA